MGRAHSRSAPRKKIKHSFARSDKQLEHFIVVKRSETARCEDRVAVLLDQSIACLLAPIKMRALSTGSTRVALLTATTPALRWQWLAAAARA